MALLDALRALASFTPPPALPALSDPELELLAEVLAAHGLAPLASYQLENTRLGARVPVSFKEQLLSQYQGIVNDNVMKVLTLRGALRLAPDVPAILLDACAYVDWLYPHLAWRPIGDVRFALRAEDAPRFTEAVKGALTLDRTEHDGRVAVFTDGKIGLQAQEGLWAGGPADEPLFARSVAYRAFGPRAARPSPEDALLSTVGEQAQLGLLAPLITYVDVRELLRIPLDAAYVRGRAEALGLSRALRGALALTGHWFPEVSAQAAALAPELGFAERLAVDRVVDAARDPARLRHFRGVDAAARLVVAP